jgi:hypothetical protein
MLRIRRRLTWPPPREQNSQIKCLLGSSRSTAAGNPHSTRAFQSNSHATSQLARVAEDATRPDCQTRDLFIHVVRSMFMRRHASSAIEKNLQRTCPKISDQPRKPKPCAGQGQNGALRGRWTLSLLVEKSRDTWRECFAYRRRSMRSFWCRKRSMWSRVPRKRH